MVYSGSTSWYSLSQHLEIFKKPSVYIQFANHLVQNLFKTHYAPKTMAVKFKTGGAIVCRDDSEYLVDYT